jgi:hypothetical protein
MKHANCPHEEAVTRAARTGDWETSLSAHAANCAVCGGIVNTSRWMQALAQGSESNHALPDAGMLWRSAQLSEKREKTEGSQNFLEWMAFASIAVPCLGLTAWLAWNWYAIQGWIAWTVAGAQLRMTAYWVPILFSSIVPVLFLAAFALVYPSLVDE